MAVLTNFAIPKGSTVLVTGANGFIASHTVDQFLERGYNVRGTVRDPTKSAWVSALFEQKYGKGRFELVHVPDMGAENAYSEAVKGVSAVVHTTTIVSLDPNPNNVIPAAIAGALNAVKAAYAEPTVQRFVYTSSSTAALSSTPDAPAVTVKKDTWNEEAVKQAWGSDPTVEAAGVKFVYPASKVQAEQAIWKFYEENKAKRSDIVINTVLPNFNMGKSLDPVNQKHPSTSMIPPVLFAGLVLPQFNMFPPQYHVDVQDTARLHVAGAIHPDVEGERIFAYAGIFNWDNVLDVFRKNHPERSFPENFSGGTDNSIIEERPRSEQLLRDLGRPGWTSLEDSVLANVEELRVLAPEELSKVMQKILYDIQQATSQI